MSSNGPSEGKTGRDQKDFGKELIIREATKEGRRIGEKVAKAATGAAAAAVYGAAAGTTTSLTVGSGFAPFVAAIGAAKVASLPSIVLFLFNPVGAALATGALAVAGAAGYTIAKRITKKI